MATSMNKKKVATSKSTVEKINTTETDNKTVAENIKEDVKPKAKKFESTDEISCRSITVGTLVMTGKRTRNSYIWLNDGDVINVEYQDLQALVMARSQYIYRPCFIIDDEDFVEQNPQLKKFYESMYTTRDLRTILYIEDDNEMVNAINSMPHGLMSNLRNLASTMVMNHEIDSIRRVKTLEKVLDMDLSNGFAD